MTLYTHGTKVLVGNGSVEGTVLAVALAGHDYQKVTYFIEWWDDKTCKSEWIDAIGVEAIDESTPRITLGRASA
jgi:hypothetical protein